MHFTPDFVLLGSDKFYALDLDTFEISGTVLEISLVVILTLPYKLNIILFHYYLYTVSISNFIIQILFSEFLNRNDPSLAYAMFGAAQDDSFPVAALQVAPVGQPEEFLLCFHGMRIMVCAILQDYSLHRFWCVC
jgi:hypothetical protein